MGRLLRFVVCLAGEWATVTWGVQMSDFPAHLFALSGSPEAVSASAQKYWRFGQTASGAADRITGMDTSQFVGPEADQYREKLNSDLPPNLRVTGEAFTKVSGALSGFSSRLSELQSRMRPVAAEARTAWQRLQAAKAGLAEAHASDQRQQNVQDLAERQHTQAVADTHARNQSVPAAPHTTFIAATPGAQAELEAAKREWEALLDNATSLRSEMASATQTCRATIDEAKTMRFKAPPGTFDLIGKGEDWLREHGDPLGRVASLLNSATAAIAVVGVGLNSFLSEAKDAFTALAVDATLTLRRISQTVNDAMVAAWQWTKDHADLINKAGDVLSTVGTVLSVVAVATCWIPGVDVITAGAALGVSAAALGTHALAKAAGAKVPGTTMAFDALSAIPGAGAAKGGAASARILPRAFNASRTAAKFAGEGKMAAGVEAARKVFSRTGAQAVGKQASYVDGAIKFLARSQPNSLKLIPKDAGLALNSWQTGGKTWLRTPEMAHTVQSVPALATGTGLVAVERGGVMVGKWEATPYQEHATNMVKNRIGDATQGFRHALATG